MSFYAQASASFPSAKCMDERRGSGASHLRDEVSMRSLKSLACQSETLRRIRRLSSRSPRRWGKMTANQMVCHLSDSYQMALGDRPAKDRSSPLTRTWVKWKFLYSPFPWPQGVQTSPRNDSLRDGTRPAVFREDLERLTRVFEGFVQAAAAGRCKRHPRFGFLTADEWLRWGYRHADHHLRQFRM